MNGYRETESGLLVPQPPIPAGMSAIFARVHEALVLTDLVPWEEQGSMLVGLDIALQHPEWARAIIDGLRVYAIEGDVAESNEQIRAFIEACPVTFEHEPEQAEEPST